MKVGLGLSFFDNAREIPRCLGDMDDPKSLCNNVNHIIGINGRYDGYDADHNYSEDGSDEIFKRYPKSIVENYHGYQTDKRQRYLDIAGELGCEFLIVIDTDEYLHPQYRNWTQFFTNLHILARKFPEHKLFNMLIFMDKNWERAHNKWVRRNSFRKYIRLHKDPGSMRYCCQTHYYWSNKMITDEMLVTGQGLMLNALEEPIDGIRFKTDSLLRDNETLRLRDKWAWNTTHEENRRVAVLKDKFYYKKNLFADHDLKEFWNYDKTGKPIT